IFVGNVVTLEAEVTYVGRTSIETRVEVVAENPLTGITTPTNIAYLVYVAIDEHGRPQPVPPLEPIDDAERARMEEARQRQAYRKQQRALEKQRRSSSHTGDKHV